MNTAFRKSGYFWTIIFFTGYLVSAFTGALAHSDLSLPQAMLSPNALSSLGVALLFLLSSRFTRLAWIQPAIFFLISPLGLIGSHVSFYGLSFFAVGVILLFRLGFFERHRIPKLLACLAWLYGWQIFSGLRAERSLVYAFTPVFVITVFLVFLYLAFQEKLAVYLKEPKPVLDLSAKGLSPGEARCVRALLAGKDVKELVFESGLAESTIRTTLSRAYKKLGLEGQTELLLMAERFEVRLPEPGAAEEGAKPEGPAA